jgi:putative nucleotidyltransferase-like protein
MASPQERTENEVLLLCARRELAPQQRDRLRALVSEDLDWNYFYNLARRHSLLPLVYKQLEQHVRDSLAAEAQHRFRKAYQQNAARNVIFADELTSIIKACADTGVDVIAFKGPALAVAAYGDLALRRFVDLDVMVQRADVPRAIEVITARGYVSSKPLDPGQQALLIRTQHNLQFTKGRLLVELHWQVSPELFASTVTAEELWQNLETVRINQAEVKTLSINDLLFSLCVHGSRHIWQRLAWICDIDRLMATRQDIDWPALIERARAAHAERMFLLGPALCARLLKTELPKTIHDAITNDAQIELIATEIQDRLFDGEEPQPAGLATTFRYNYRIRSDWRSRLRYCRHMLDPTDSDVESIRLSRPLHFVYYLLRPFRLLRN